MLVLGGTDQAFVGMGIVDEGLYFAVEDAKLTRYASVVLLVFLGLTGLKVAMLVGAWGWMRRVQSREGRTGMVEEKAEKGGSGWRRRLDGKSPSASLL